MARIFSVLDPATLNQTGFFSFANPSPSYISSEFPERGTQRLYMVSQVYAGSSYQAAIYAGNTQTLTTSPPLLIPVPYVYGNFLNLTRWGSDGVAFHAYSGSTNLGGFNANDQIVFARTKLTNPTSGTNPVPSISSLSSSGVPMRTANTVVTVIGSNFVPGVTAYWNGDERSTEYVDATHLNVYLPATDFSTVATAQITVTNPPQGGGTSNAVQFGVTSPAPAQLSASSLDFGSQFVWVRGSGSSVIITNTGASPLPIASITVTGSFNQVNNCGSAVPAFSSCTMTVTFVPSTTGSSTGSLTVQHDLVTTPSTVALSGTGVDIVFSLGRPGRSSRSSLPSLQPAARAFVAQMEVIGGAVLAEFSCSAAAHCSIAPTSAMLQPGVPFELSAAAGTAESVQVRVKALGQVKTISLSRNGQQSVNTVRPVIPRDEPVITTQQAPAAGVRSSAALPAVSGGALGVYAVGDPVNVVLSERDRMYEKWLREDVAYLATPDEVAQFKQLNSDRERDRFIEQFWERRSPQPGSAPNKFKEEHYRRIAYANEHFATNIAGWKTDRGRIYIVYGPPDWVRDERPASAAAPAAQLWHYGSIPNQGTDVTLRFVDVCRCGDYRLTSPSSGH